MKKAIKVLAVVLVVVIVVTIAFVIGSKYGENKKEQAETTTVQTAETTTLQVAETTTWVPETTTQVTETTTASVIQEPEAYLFYRVNGELMNQKIQLSETLEQAEPVKIPEHAEKYMLGENYRIDSEIRIDEVSGDAKVEVVYEALQTKATNAQVNLNNGVTTFWYWSISLWRDQTPYVFKVTISEPNCGEEIVRYFKIVP